ncbi:MAG: hypothetical protein H6Q90_4170 [Deltaproteobacteria bacterium]|nr:hypothetical protein [Deltaproteobacteria bacterium]
MPDAFSDGSRQRAFDPNINSGAGVAPVRASPINSGAGVGINSGAGVGRRGHQLRCGRRPSTPVRASGAVRASGVADINSGAGVAGAGVADINSGAGVDRSSIAARISPPVIRGDRGWQPRPLPSKNA